MSSPNNFTNLSVPEKVFYLHQVGVDTVLSILKSIPGLPFKGLGAVSELASYPVSALRGIVAGFTGTPSATTSGGDAPKSAASEEPKRIVLTTKS